MGSDRERVRPTRLLRLGAAVGGSTVMLSATFVGVVAVLSGPVAGTGVRVPYYVLGAAAAFTVAVIALEDRREDPRAILGGTVGVGVVTLVVLSLGSEGVLYATTYPQHLQESQLIVYVVAAALLCTGLGFWGVRHWRELDLDGPGRPRRRSGL